MVPLHQQIHDLVAGVNIAATTRSSGESGTWGHAQQHGVETLRLPSKRCVRAQSEALAGLAPAPAASSPFEREVLSGLRFARTCYEHLAGRLGVALHDRLLEMDLIRGDGVEHRVTPAGADGLAASLGLTWRRPRPALEQPLRRAPGSGG